MFFRAVVCFTTKQSGRYRNFSHVPCPYTCLASSRINITHEGSTFLLTKNEPTLTRHNRPRSTACRRFTLGDARSTDLDKCRITCIHHYYIIHSIFTALIILRAPPKNLLSSNATALNPGNDSPAYCLHSFPFLRMSYKWNYTICNLFILASHV